MPQIRATIAAVTTLAIVLANWGYAGEREYNPNLLEIYNASTMKYVHPKGFDTPEKDIQPITLICAKNGMYAAQVVILDGDPLEEIQAIPTELKGPGVIPAKNVETFFSVCDGVPSRRGKLGHFDSLDTVRDDERIILSRQGRTIQPIWIRVRVPADAKPGEYTGHVKISVASGKKSKLTLKVKVFDYALPDPTKFHGHMDIIQSPESVALAYDLEMWSDEHFAMLDKSFANMKPLGCKTIYISVVRRTHYGNEHGMVRFYNDDRGELQPSFDVAERYLDTAIKHLGKIPGVIFYCWEPVDSSGHAGGTGTAVRTNDRPMKYTLWDKKKDRLKKRTGPDWGTPESKALWKRFSDGAIAMLKKRGMEKSMMFGLIGDSRPTKNSMDDICNGVKGARWAVHSHHYCGIWQTYKIGMCVALWGIHLNMVDPKQGRGYGWQNPDWLAYYPREFHMRSSLAEQRYKMEAWSGAFSQHEMKYSGVSRTARGLGRIGGDFWKVLRDGRGRRAATLAGRYPEAYWGQLNLNYCISNIFGLGAKGPVPSVRSEAFREGTQDLEARIFVEKAILIPKYRAMVGEELAKKCRAMLDDRIRMAIAAGVPPKGKRPVLDPTWPQKNEALYTLAAEVAKKVGTHYIAESYRPKPKKKK